MAAVARNDPVASGGKGALKSARETSRFFISILVARTRWKFVRVRVECRHYSLDSRAARESVTLRLSRAGGSRALIIFAANEIRALLRRPPQK